jgi:cation transport regulator
MNYQDDPRREEIAHRIAWSAVKRLYAKRDGEWVRKNGSRKNQANP